MQIAITSAEHEGLARLVQGVATAPHTVGGFDHEHIEAEIRRQPPDVLVIDLPGSGGPDLVRRLRAADPSGLMYVISVVGEHLPARASTSALASGSHDVLCAPYTTQELCARIDVHRRLRGWVTSKGTPALKPPRTELVELRAWDFLGDVIADDLEAMFGRPLEIDQRWLPDSESLQLATIAMSLAAEQLELCISIVADTGSRTWLGQALLGDPAAPDDALDDVMREMANVAGGALKRAALIEGPVLSTGIPVDGRSLPGRESGARCWTIRLENENMVGVIGEVRRRAIRRIPAVRLREGMIIVTDVRSRAGALLLASGTRLTSTSAERLSALLDDGTLVDVTAA